MMACVPDALHFIHVIEALLSGGHSVRLRAPGWSMHPTIRNGEAITVAPLGESPIQVGDVVLYRRGRAAIAHRVIRVQSTAGQAAGFVLRGDAAFSATVRSKWPRCWAG
jgi:signal peptidase I